MLTPYDRSAKADSKTMQDRVDLYLSKLTLKPGHDTTQYDGVELTAGVQNCFEHGLGRECRGFRIVSVDCGAGIFKDETATQDPNKFLVLGTDIDCVVSIEVF